MSVGVDDFDPTDRGLPHLPEEGMVPLPRLRRSPTATPVAPAPQPASAEHRARIIARVAAEKGWAPTRSSRRVHRPCRRCGAEPAQWCRRSARTERQLGFVHPERDDTESSGVSD